MDPTTFLLENDLTSSHFFLLAWRRFSTWWFSIKFNLIKLKIKSQGDIVPQNSRIYSIWAGKPSFFHISKLGQTLKSVSLHLCTLILFNYLFLCNRTSERTGVWNSFALQIIRTINISATFFPVKIVEIISHWGWVPSIVFVYKQKIKGF